ncbi:hypothetical protein AGMMS49975_00720 [Clostridia bacterium]|nr:hypothetical protein AGMMS49975_00720 [Clostridia bacterium]
MFPVVTASLREGKIAVLLDDLKSPLLTADWERKLKQVECGELADAEFMGGIEALVKGLVSANAAPLPEKWQPLFSMMASVGDSGARVAAKGKTLDPKTVAAFLSEGCVCFSDLKSEYTGKTYAATVILEDNGEKTDFRLEFDSKRKGGKT